MGRDSQENSRIASEYIESLNGQPASPTELGRRLERTTERARQILGVLYPEYPRVPHGEGLRRFARRKRVQTDEAVARFVDGPLTQQQIGKEVNRNRTVVSRSMIRQGKPRGFGFFYQRQRQALDAKVAPYVRSDLTVAKIAQEIGSNPSSVSKSLRRQEEKRGKGGGGRSRGKTT